MCFGRSLNCGHKDERGIFIVGQICIITVTRNVRQMRNGQYCYPAFIFVKYSVFAYIIKLDNDHYSINFALHLKILLKNFSLIPTSLFELAMTESVRFVVFGHPDLQPLYTT